MLQLHLHKSSKTSEYLDQLGFRYSREEVSDLIMKGQALIIDTRPKEVDLCQFNELQEAFFSSLQ